jgi:two-component system LytT family sensor kinase
MATDVRRDVQRLEIRNEIPDTRSEKANRHEQHLFMKTAIDTCEQPLSADEEDYGCSGESGPPEIRPWRIWIISFGVWSLVALAAGVTIYRLYHATHTPMSFTSALALEFCDIFPYALLTPFVFTFATRYPIRRNNWTSRALLYLAVGLVFTAAHVALKSVTPYGFWDPQYHEWRSAIWDSHTHRFGVEWSVLPEQFLTSLFNDIAETFIPIVLAAHAVSYNRTLRERDLRAAQLEGQLATARLQALKSQLQPHFLFNTMHSISSLMLTDVEAADRMMTRLGDLLRMSLESAGTQVTTLSREIQSLNGYLEIEKVRFAERLNVTLDISPETLDASVPHLLLQPLVDNAVKHGISKLSDGGEIRIVARIQADQLQIEIRDNGPGLSNNGGLRSSGLGLRITRERLESLYGEEQSLQLLNLPGGGTLAQVCIPFSCISFGGAHPAGAGRNQEQGLA